MLAGENKASNNNNTVSLVLSLAQVGIKVITIHGHMTSKGTMIKVLEVILALLMRATSRMATISIMGPEPW